MRLSKPVFIAMMAFIFAACGQVSVGIAMATATNQPEPISPTPSPLPSDTPTLPSLELSFQAETYRDDALGFELDYPAEWDAPVLVEQQARGRIVQARMDEQVMMDIVTLRWDPPEDLGAFLSVREQAFEGSGFTMLDKKVINLTEGWDGVEYKVETLTGEQAYFFFTTMGNRYLQLSGSGDIDLLAEIASTVRKTQ